ncbi:zinc finger protein JACKDAW [Cicer arietinum]|uniref:Zinc finger protein JACKDAW-like n=1 Tax=Cicer arietinum TaxID=3827 RepID=A0A1S2Y0U8_CICAR|nr:zinc finger protein JACKDAW-like [Cicer arietinum]
MQMIPNDPFSLSTSIGGFISQEQNTNPNPKPNTPPIPKKKRNLPGTPDPDAEVIALSPKTLMATNRFICEICNKGFQRDQNLQLHRRGHNLPWKLRQRSNKEVKKKVYICPEKTCVHHDPGRALGDLTGIKKHFSRKHGEKKWKCEKCSKKYAVQSDWKAHTKTCGTREYKCDCGTLFSRKDSFITHRAFCDALAEESARLTSVTTTNLNFKNEEGGGGGVNTMIGSSQSQQHGLSHGILENVSQFGSHGFHVDFNNNNNLMMNSENQRPSLSLWLNQGNHNQQISDMGQSSGLFGSSGNLSEIVQMGNVNNNNGLSNFGIPVTSNSTSSANLSLSSSVQKKQYSKTESVLPMSATALLQKAAQMGSTRSTSSTNNPSIFSASFGVMTSSPSSSSSQSNTINNSSSNVNVNNFSSSSSFDQFLMQTNNGQGKFHFLQHGGGSTSNSMDHQQSHLTRDFLGVSGGRGGAVSHQFLPHELAKFALSQFTGNR